MKSLTELTIRNLPVKPFQGPVLTYLSLSVLIMALFVLLTACSDRKATTTVPEPAPTASNTATATRNTTMLAPAPQTTAGTQPATAGEATAPEEAFSSQSAERPTLSLSPAIIQIGQSVEISGTGYPASTRLNIRLASANFGADSVYASVVTDANGAFTTTLTLDNASKTTLLTPGKIEFLVTTPDNRIGASAPLALQAPANASEDETCKNLVSEFFATLKRDTSLAQVYLSANLRSRIVGGDATLNALLGVNTAPLRVDISKVKDTANSYLATMYLSSGEQKSAVLNVSTDTSGALKISAIKTQN